MAKIVGPGKDVKYSSVSTRYASLDSFAGEPLDQSQPPVKGLYACEKAENLEARFNSGVNRTDCPRMWGHPSVDRRIGKKKQILGNELSSWRREHGLPLYKK